MVRVKVIKLPKCVTEDDKYIKLGQVYEAFELRDEKSESDFYKHFFVLNIGWGIFNIEPENVEVIEDDANEKVGDNNNNIVKSYSQQKILLVEDGSVDIDNLEEWCTEQNIKLIVYRSGANKPEWLNL